MGGDNRPPSSPGFSDAVVCCAFAHYALSPAPTVCPNMQSVLGLTGGAADMMSTLAVHSGGLLFGEHRQLTVRLCAQVGGDLRDGLCVTAGLCLLRLSVGVGKVLR